MSTIIIITPPNPPKPAKSATQAEKDAWVKAHVQAYAAELDDPNKLMPEYSYSPITWP